MSKTILIVHLLLASIVLSAQLDSIPVKFCSETQPGDDIEFLLIDDNDTIRLSYFQNQLKIPQKYLNRSRRRILASEDSLGVDLLIISNRYAYPFSIFKNNLNGDTILFCLNYKESFVFSHWWFRKAWTPQYYQHGSGVVYSSRKRKRIKR